jgi:pimeloyl-ACP methyl ester carboxylesterase
VPCETRRLETPSAATYVRASGNPAHPPLVLLHGARGNSLMWVPNIAALSAAYRTYALDTPGETGLSVSRRRMTRAEEVLGWLEEALDALAPEGALNLAGLSYGGWLACQYARRHPERVRRLALLAPAATVLPVSGALLARALLSLLPGRAGRRRFYYWLLRDSVESGPAGRAWVDAAIEDWALAERCFKTLLLAPATVLDEATLRAWAPRTLVLLGENEKIYSARRAVERLRRVAPQIEARVMPGGGHDLWAVRAEAVNRVVVDFLNGDEH